MRRGRSHQDSDTPRVKGDHGESQTLVKIPEVSPNPIGQLLLLFFMFLDYSRFHSPPFIYSFAH